MTPSEQDAIIDAVGLPVAPGLVPAVVQPARPGRANPFLVAAVVVGALVLVATVVGGMLWLYSTHGREAAQERGALAFGAVLAADSQTLRKVVPGAAAAGVPDAVWVDAAKRGRDVVFGDATWDGPSVRLPYSFSGKPGSLRITPDDAHPGVLKITTTGQPFGSSTGRMVMVREWDGWKAASIVVGSETLTLDAAGIRSVLGH